MVLFLRSGGVRGVGNPPRCCGCRCRCRCRWGCGCLFFREPARGRSARCPEGARRGPGPEAKPSGLAEWRGREAGARLGPKRRPGEARRAPRDATSAADRAANRPRAQLRRARGRARQARAKRAPCSREPDHGGAQRAEPSQMLWSLRLFVLAMVAQLVSGAAAGEAEEVGPTVGGPRREPVRLRAAGGGLAADPRAAALPWSPIRGQAGAGPEGHSDAVRPSQRRVRRCRRVVGLVERGR